MESNLTTEIVQEALDYDPTTGVFLWKKPQSNRVKIGQRAGVVATNGRRYINICGEKVMAHRLAWFIMCGEWPAGDVKQKNGNHDDCRFGNLIDQTRTDTAKNRRVNHNSKSGHPGVTWVESRQKWQVHITQNYKQVGLGYYDELSEAITVRETAQQSLVIEISETERAKAAHIISRRRHQRNSWKRLPEAHGWASFDDFCADVGDVPATTKALMAIDTSKPVGPDNFRWSLPPEDKHDFKSREGRIVYMRAHRGANPDLYRDKELRKKFGIGLAEYNLMLALQRNACAICEKPESVVRNGKDQFLSVDHNHSTGAIRGLLCTNCNVAIGMLCDDVSVLTKAISYLKEHQPRVIPFRDPKRDWLLVATPNFEGNYG